MKLFIDTSNQFVIFGLLNSNNEIVSFEKNKVEKSTVKLTNFWLDKFLQKNKTKLLDITGFYLTIGPGSYTGTKVAFNIVSTISMFNKVVEYNIIDCLTLQAAPDSYSVIQIGKNKFLINKKKYFSKNAFSIFTKEQIDKVCNDSKCKINFEDFEKKDLQLKITNKEFKKVTQLDKIKLRYIKGNF